MTSSAETTVPAPRDDWGPAPTAGDRACLSAIAGHMIPASAEHGMPGADDPLIVADMVASLQRDRRALVRRLRRVDEAAGGCFVSLDTAARAALLVRLRAADPAGFAVVEAVVVRAYYRDPRVLAAIGMEPRPPFPKGYALPETDWSLLDPVRRRGSIWRPAD